MRNIELFSFPIKTLFIDDDLEALKAYKHLPIENEIITSNDPLLVIDDLLKQPAYNEYETFISPNLFLANENEINFSSIRDFVENRANNTPEVIIVDYQMPTINGLDFCKKINELKSFKVLLTGEYAPLNAINALNNKEIDFFIQKGNDLVYNQIVQAIDLFKQKYFLNITNKINEAIRLDFIDDSNYKHIFSELMEKHKFIEYFALNEYGCYQLKTKDETYILNIYTEEQLDGMCEMFSHLDSDVLASVRRRERIFNCNILNGQLEGDLIYPAQSREQFFYALAKL